MNSKLKTIDYGKSRVRVAKVQREAGQHGFRDLTVDIRLQGPFEDAYLKGDNSLVVPTDTMKNVVYAVAASHDMASVEAFGQSLAEHFLNNYAHVSGANIDLVEHNWLRLDPYAFALGPSCRLVCVESTRDRVVLQAGIDNLVLLKTTKSGFTGFLRDRYTTLPETDDRILATAVKAVWRYATLPADFNACFAQCQRTLTDVFVAHDSKAVQETLYAMGDAVLSAQPEIDEIRLTMPNRHYLPVDLTPLGLENRNEIFLPTSEPHGSIEACLTRN